MHAPSIHTVKAVLIVSSFPSITYVRNEMAEMKTGVATHMLGYPEISSIEGFRERKRYQKNPTSTRRTREG
jgi:hypothetical protein